MSNKALVNCLNIVLLSAACLTPVMAETAAPHAEKLTQITAVALKKLNMSDADKKLENMSLEKVVTAALHEGHSIDDVRAAVSQAMEEVTGKALKSAGSASSVSTVNSSVVSVSGATGSGDARVIPLTTQLLPNESLSTVAKRIYGPENGRRYLDIYELNKDVISDINVIPVGTVLQLPR